MGMPMTRSSISRSGQIVFYHRALAAIESCLSDVQLHSRLLTNDSKTEFLTVGSRQQLSKKIN